MSTHQSGSATPAADRDVPRHQVDEQLIDRALDDVYGRVRATSNEIYEKRRLTLPLLEGMRDDLLDHVAARTVKDTENGLPPLPSVLRTAAECGFGALNLGVYPNGDFEIPMPFVFQEVGSEDGLFVDVERAATARTWLDAFALCVTSGLVWDWRRVIGLLLRNDFAPDIRQGVPYSRRESVSEPAESAEMDALCHYLTPASGHRPADRPRVPLRRPDPEERAEAVRALDGAGASSPDQRLLRVLLQDDREAFEAALADRLDRYREGEEEAGAGRAPRSLLPLNAIALAALAVQVHGWTRLRVRSDYLPEFMLNAPEDAPPVTA